MYCFHPLETVCRWFCITGVEGGYYGQMPGTTKIYWGPLTRDQCGMIFANITTAAVFLPAVLLILMLGYFPDKGVMLILEVITY